MIISMVKKDEYQPLIINRSHDKGILKVLRIDLKIITNNYRISQPNLIWILSRIQQ